jgi:hypothetical protein
VKAETGAGGAQRYRAALERGCNGVEGRSGLAPRKFSTQSSLNAAQRRWMSEQPNSFGGIQNMPYKKACSLDRTTVTLIDTPTARSRSASGQKTFLSRSGRLRPSLA